MKRQRVIFDLLTEFFLLLSISAFLLFPGFHGYQTIQETKFEAFCLLFGGYLALMVLSAVELRLIGRCKWPNPSILWHKASWTQRLVVIYWLLTLASTLCSPLREHAVWGMTRQEGLVTITIYCGCFLCISVYGELRRWMLDVFGVTTTLFAILCLLQLGGNNPLSLYPAGFNYFGANVDYPGVYLGTIGNADLVAALLCLVIPVLWVALIRLKDRHRWWLTLPLVLNLLVLVKMDVQAGVLGMLVGTVLSIPVVLPVNNRTKKVLWLLVVVALVLSLRFIWTSNRTWGTIYEMREVLHGNWNDTFGTGRLFIWKNVLLRVPRHLWLGAGPDTMAALNLTGYVYTNGEVSIPYLVDVAHNEYINVLYHQGLLALLAYLGALSCSAVRWIRNSGNQTVTAILGAGMVAYCVQAFFGFSMCSTAGFFWLVWGLFEGKKRTL